MCCGEYNIMVSGVDFVFFWGGNVKKVKWSLDIIGKYYDVLAGF